MYQCEIPNCVGLRYEGCLSAQTKATRRPCNFFVIADVSCQLKYLFEQNGILESVHEVKAKAKLARDSNTQSISDITEGQYHHSLMKEGEFLSNPNYISALFNTDGIPLYKSSRVKLWPIFLAINEIPLSQRFSRENIILVGTWQGKGNPPFLHYLNAFGEEMCKLHDEGIVVSMANGAFKETVTGKLAVLVGVLDLQAKGYVLNEYAQWGVWVLHL